MRPVIPRTRPGDILKGTRNLRGYLQTVVTLSHLRDLDYMLKCGVRPRNKKSRNVPGKGYRPSKDERFLVVVNAWDRFGVYSLNSDVILLFSNPLTRPSRLALTRMDPTIFSKWFIRTPEKITALNKWPDPAHYMWVSLHLNTSGIPHDTDTQFHCSEGFVGPFSMNPAKNTDQLPNRGYLRKVVRQWMVRGSTRTTFPSHSRLPVEGFGPILKDIESMKKEIRALCTNPKMAQLLRTTEKDPKVFSYL